MKREGTRTIKKNDIILIGALLAAALVSVVIMLAARETGAEVVIYVDGERRESFALSEETSYRIETEYGFNELAISGGKAYLEDADCPDLVCVKTGAISYAGQTIVCLPHRMVIAIEGGASDVDVIAE